MNRVKKGIPFTSYNYETFYLRHTAVGYTDYLSAEEKEPQLQEELEVAQPRL